MFDEDGVRAAAFSFLDNVSRRLGGLVRFEDVAGFTYSGERIPLLDPQRGIRKPRQLSAALSMRTVYAARSDARPYEDDIGYDGFLRYKWRGDNPQHPENRSLREAMRQRRPLIWFQGIAQGLYVPVYPVWLLEEEADRQQFVVALDEMQLTNESEGNASTVGEQERRYGQRIVRQRLHQPVFRAKVLLEYERQCALCRLKHIELLDAAHIQGDALGGAPVVTNGIAMCKIHHAAFDVHILGIRPDYKVHVRADVLAEVDGPTLKHSLQELHGHGIEIPSRVAARPSKDLLEERYEAFLRAC